MISDSVFKRTGICVRALLATLVTERLLKSQPLPLNAMEFFNDVNLIAHKTYSEKEDGVTYCVL